jgi:rhodanese-related sulfurtransferase
MRISARHGRILAHIGITASRPPPPSRATVIAMNALEHFEKLLEFETDCWDVHCDLKSGKPDYIILDVRSPEAYGAGHVPGAINLPHGRIVERNLAGFPAGVAFVVYCSGPHCNGADKAAVRLARLNRKVKKMLGGIAGWQWEGFELEQEVRSQAT